MSFLCQLILTKSMRLIDANALNVRSYCRWFDDPDDVRVVERMIREAPTITPPPNPPLTMDELREMDGEPVWVEFPKCKEATGWMLVSVNRHCVYDGLLGDCDFENSGKTWLAYRRKPEEGTT